MLCHQSLIVIVLCLDLACSDFAEVGISDKLDVDFKSPHSPNRPLRPPEIVKEILKNYKKQEPPLKDKPTEVKLGIYVNSFYSISEQTMDYRVSMYFRQQWYDNRLNFKKLSNRTAPIRMGDRGWEEIWTPDTFFRNEKQAHFHAVTVNNRLLRIFPEGKVWYVIKISPALACQMTLQKYPMDTQKCPIMFESFGYTMDVMYFQWLERPVEIEAELQIPQFQLADHILYDCSLNYTGGAFPCLEIKFILDRDIGYFLIQVYVPTILIVILSWVSFWINVDASPARVSIGLLTVLTTTTMSAGARASLPRVSYIKAIDVWMIICLIFVFTSLIEYAVVNAFSRKPARAAKKKSSTKHSHTQHCQMQPSEFGSVRNGPDRREATNKTTEKDGRYKARKVDKFSRRTFPLSFLLFNIIYWVFYTIPNTSSDMTE